MQKRATASFCCMNALLFGLFGWACGALADDSGLIPKSAQTAILRGPDIPSVGAKNADVSVVEYFDYNCSFCKKLSPALAALLNSDPKVRLVYKDWPILSEVSAYAAESALAAGAQGKYRVAHDALMAAPHLASHEQVDVVLQKAGIDMDVLKRDREAQSGAIMAALRRNDTEAGALGIRGTPGLLVGRQLVNGVYDVAGLEQVVATARRER